MGTTPTSVGSHHCRYHVQVTLSNWKDRDSRRSIKWNVDPTNFVSFCCLTTGMVLTLHGSHGPGPSDRSGSVHRGVCRRLGRDSGTASPREFPVGTRTHCRLEVHPR